MIYGISFTGIEQTRSVEDDSVTIQAESDEFSNPPEMPQGLEEALHQTQANAYNKCTLKNLICQWKSFGWFYVRYKIKEWPIMTHTMCLYARFLAYSFKSAGSVRSYVSGVRTLHILLRVNPPDLKDIEVIITF